jgi:RNA 2',3'-cyclic 3'-phosphodiesterase
MQAAIRAFIAIALPVHIVRYVEALQNHLKASGLKLSWVRPQNIHLTLKFLGEIEPSLVEDAVTAMQSAVRENAPFELTVQGVGVFPTVRRPRVLWVGVGGQTDGLVDLHRCLDDALAAAGFARETRPFKAHLTLARIKGGVAPQQLIRAMEDSGREPPRSMPVEEIALFQSRLQSTGAVYTLLARGRLAGN